MGLWSYLKQLLAPASRRFGAWQVELTTRCPLRCRMCIRQGLDGWQGQDMDITQFSASVPISASWIMSSWKAGGNHSCIHTCWTPFTW